MSLSKRYFPINLQISFSSFVKSQMRSRSNIALSDENQIEHLVVFAGTGWSPSLRRGNTMKRSTSRGRGCQDGPQVDTILINLRSPCWPTSLRAKPIPSSSKSCLSRFPLTDAIANNSNNIYNNYLVLFVDIALHRTKPWGKHPKECESCLLQVQAI